jgi:CAAX protease family protein
MQSQSRDGVVTAPVTEFLKRHSLIVGFALMFALTWPLDLGLAAQSRGLLPFRIPQIVGLFVGYGLVVATLIMTGLILGKDGILALLRRFLIWRVGIQWYVVALFGMPVIFLMALSLNTLLGGALPDFTKIFARRIFGNPTNVWYYVIPFFVIDFVANGEEIGWRGYALPRLQVRHSPLVSSLILGGVWALWHMPKFLAAGNNNPVGLFLLDTVAKAVLFTWVYNNTNGSLLMATMFHAAINTASVFLPIPTAVTGDVRPFAIAVVLEILAAVAVTVVAGRAQLSRVPPARVP